ncbi:very short patch repair endonuclease [Burkholderia multivorans]|uniref:very short patch repair endonuclease n=2 Tax=Burkholderia multivorans TaxID=87883 RepID=UPI0012DBF3A5|nr:very short patch repair endonuclease [Burkholderia multivorans]MBN6730870.1 very short patch repair endonuclease [Burkholderia multivorans]MBN6733857.1 very short patch repair endonuclease [Burkholderia multivorans]MBN6738937.1 very short patch repair endonuclease [Burkholderia multivorans]MBN7126117.1 very short patch repair endonuclease [Burkholderia multivorans]MBN8166759.1 very short patch repair endonuclease [Burkholderia multivorans]
MAYTNVSGRRICGGIGRLLAICYTPRAARRSDLQTKLLPVVQSKVTDILPPEQRSARMGRVRQHGTDIELRLRRALWAAGLRYRFAQAKVLPGRPDIVFVSAKVAVFVDGCFWHGCPKHGTKPKSNAEFWDEKIRRNRERDRRVDCELQQAGWRVVRLWEHEVKKELDDCVTRIALAIRAPTK